MKLILSILLLSSLTASAQKKTKVWPADTIWTSAHRFDTMVVIAEDANGKLVNVRAVYEWGHYGAGKDKPRFYGYLNMNKRKLTAAQRPKKIRFDKMVKK